VIRKWPPGTFHDHTHLRHSKKYHASIQHDHNHGSRTASSICSLDQNTSPTSNRPSPPKRSKNHSRTPTRRFSHPRPPPIRAHHHRSPSRNCSRPCCPHHDRMHNRHVRDAETCSLGTVFCLCYSWRTQFFIQTQCRSRWAIEGYQERQYQEETWEREHERGESGAGARGHKSS
jgi:hypothetical protein